MHVRWGDPPILRHKSTHIPLNAVAPIEKGNMEKRLAAVEEDVERRRVAKNPFEQRFRSLVREIIQNYRIVLSKIFPCFQGSSAANMHGHQRNMIL